MINDQLALHGFKKIITGLVLLSGLLTWNCSRIVVDPAARAQSEFRKALDDLLADPVLADAHVGVYIESLNDSTEIYSRNTRKLFLPASNLKLVTSAAALANLNTDFRIRTPVFAIGTISDSTLHGHLLIAGRGDPSIPVIIPSRDTLDVFSGWADSLRRHGIVNITGNIIGDDRYFTGPMLGEGWNWDDESYYYAARPSALSYYGNSVDITLYPGSRIGDSTRVNVFPFKDTMQIVNRSFTVHPDSISDTKIERRRARNVIDISGPIAAGSRRMQEFITVEDPQAYFTAALRRTLVTNGITIQDSLAVPEWTENPFSEAPLFEYDSPPLSQILYVLNKKSDNLYAENLIRIIGASLAGEASAEKGIEAINDWMAAIGMPEKGCLMVDGSGLSRKNLMSPQALAELLRYMYHQPYFNTFFNSLPIAGIDGTLEKRMSGTPAQNRIFAKTGSMSRVRNLSGYARNASGQWFLFVIMMNNFSAPVVEIDRLQALICSLLAEFNPKLADRD